LTGSSLHDTLGLMLSSSVLVLNRSYIPINITTVRRALVLMYQGMARAVDKQYETFDFATWAELSECSGDERVHLIDKAIGVPRVILLAAYNHVPKRYVRFSRYNIYLRDRNTCQYCGQNFARTELNLDHVTPRRLGGKTNWSNVVTSCLLCNNRKGGHLLHEVGMKLIQKPVHPKWTPFLDFTFKKNIHEAWRPFFGLVDFSYWNVELDQD
jgi:5-methylcytosine-specific restriction endonuclease McrA